jgi:hypothetical protein
MNIKNIIIFILIFVSISYSQEEIKNFDDLIIKWENRDGVQRLELSPLLAKKFILEDTIFLAKMNKNKKVFNSWVENLQNDIFTIYNYKDSVDIKLETARLEKLRELMIDTANKFKDDKKYGNTAENLIDMLKKMRIDVVD